MNPNIKFAGRNLYLFGLWLVRSHSLVTWWRIDTRICIAHPPQDYANYLWN